MKSTSAKPSISFETIFLSFFGTGFSPIAPGTVGTFAALPLLYGVGLLGIDRLYLITAILIVTAFSCLYVNKIQKRDGIHDPSWIVIDEVLGIATTCCFFDYSNLTLLLIAAAVFRVFDIFKIWPASYFDTKMKHGAGTILDDIIAGGYAGLVMLLVTYAKNHLSYA